MINATQAKAMANENSGLNRILNEFDQEIMAAAEQGKFYVHKHMGAVNTEDRMLQSVISTLKDNGYKVKAMKSVRQDRQQVQYTVITLGVYWE